MVLGPGGSRRKITESRGTTVLVGPAEVVVGVWDTVPCCKKDKGMGIAAITGTGLAISGTIPGFPGFGTGETLMGRLPKPETGTSKWSGSEQWIVLEDALHNCGFSWARSESKVP
jgi:hypothetical protein